MKRKICLLISRMRIIIDCAGWLERFDKIFAKLLAQYLASSRHPTNGGFKSKPEDFQSKYLSIAVSPWHLCSLSACPLTHFLATVNSKSEH